MNCIFTFFINFYFLFKFKKRKIYNKYVLSTYMKFVHSVSKGSRFNQIYIPQKMREYFTPGNLVEVRLMKKTTKLIYSSNLKKLTPFKERIILNVFDALSSLKEIKQIFIVGSFLTNKIDYRDIDILVVSDNIEEEEVYDALRDIDLPFHVIIFSKERFNILQEICPLTRSMLSFYVSNKNFELTLRTRIDKSHIKFLLMMPEDLLNFNLSSRALYDCLRRLIVIERFLLQKSLSFDVNNEMKKLLGNVFNFLRNNEGINETILNKIRKIIRAKLNLIYKLLK